MASKSADEIIEELLRQHSGWNIDAMTQLKFEEKSAEEALEAKKKLNAT